MMKIEFPVERDGPLLSLKITKIQNKCAWHDKLNEKKSIKREMETARKQKLICSPSGYGGGCGSNRSGSNRNKYHNNTI